MLYRKSIKLVYIQLIPKLHKNQVNFNNEKSFN